MTQSFQKIFQFEDSEEFDKAFEAYNNIYNLSKRDYDVWKHFYFFLWIAIEDAPNSFHEKIDLRKLLKIMLDEGIVSFSEIADFNFIAGYTVSIFPYEYGNYNDLEKLGQQMLLKATQLQPENLIYKLAYLGGIQGVDPKIYKQAEIDAAPLILETFNGPGALNKYFRQVLYRPKNNKAKR